MSQVEWQQVKDVFYTALNRPAEERPEFLDSACGQNNAFRSEVEVLLDSYESGFMERPLLADRNSKNSSIEPLFKQGNKFSHYEILRLLGRGGMGEVYLANDLALDRLIAIKVIHADSGFGDQAAGRLIREARAAAKLDHPNICSVYEVGETDGQPFIAMQYVEGEMLDRLIERDSIAFDAAVSFTRQIAAALAKAHSCGIIHRDIKPSNIIIDSRNHLKVLDFGLAKETLLNSADADASAVGLIAGTVTYMSPEHARGQAINGQTDIWSLGVVLYQMLTGRLPFRGETRADLIAAILNKDFEAPGDLTKDLPSSINYILDRSLRKDCAERYATIEEFDADLAELIETGTVRNISGFTTGESAGFSVAGSISGNRGSVMRYALPILLLLLLAGGGYGVWKYRAATAANQPFSTNRAGSLEMSSLFDLKQQIAGTITDLRFSPNGSMIAFALSGEARHQIMVQPTSGGKPVSITNGPSIDYSPVWSLDGQRIAYLSVGDGKIAIRSVPYLGGDSEQLIELENRASSYQLTKWSNNGKRIFFEHGDGPKEIDLETGIISHVNLSGIEGTVARGFAVSPDESRILVPSIVDGNEGLWVKSLDMTDAQLLSGTIPRRGDLDWFPDSQRFAFSSDYSGNSQIYVSGLDGSGPQQVTFANSNSYNPIVSPNGNQIVFLSNYGEANLFSTDIASQKETAVTSNVQMQLFPAISPDGQSIAYQTVTGSSKVMSGALKIEPFNNDGSGLELKLDKSGCCAKWSPNGEEITFVRRTGTGFNIWKTGLSDRIETRITTGGIVMPIYSVAPFDLHDFSFGLSPDGSLIAYISRRSGSENVWTASTDGSDEKMRTNIQDDAAKLVSPFWSPTGDRIAFIEAVGLGPASISKDSRIAIFRDGETFIAAEFKSPVSLLGWSNAGDGLYVAVAKDHHYDIVLVPADRTNNFRLKTRLPGARQFGIRISPDQTSVAYTARVNDIDNLYLVPIGGGESVQVTSNGDTTLFYSGVTWSPDSKTLLYSKQTGGLQLSLITNTQ